MPRHTICGVEVLVSDLIRDPQGDPTILWIPKPPQFVLPRPLVDPLYTWLLTWRQLIGLDPLPDVQGTLTLEKLMEAFNPPPRVIILCHPEVFVEVREVITEARGLKSG